MQDFEFHVYQDCDLPNILVIEAQREGGWSEAQLGAQLQNIDTNHSSNFVLRNAQGCFAYCLFQKVLDEADLLLIVVDCNQRQRGAGSYLLKCALQNLQTTGVRYCFLDVRMSNSAAQALYKKFNFKRIALRKNYYPALQDERGLTKQSAENALLMKLALK